MKMRTYHIIATNCDCSSDVIGKTDPGKWLFGPRCPSCRKVLGCMQWMDVGRVRASGDWDAPRIYKKMLESNTWDTGKLNRECKDDTSE